MIILPSAMATAQVNKLKANAVALGVNTLDIAYGDRDNIPRYPAITVSPLTLDKESRPPSNSSDRTIRTVVFAYWSKLDQKDQARQLAAHQFGEAVMGVLDSDPQWAGEIIFGMVRRIEHGFAARQGGLIYVSRITWQGRVITNVL